MSALDQLFANVRVQANIFNNAQYCGLWAVDTSGSRRLSFHVVSAGRCALHIEDQTIELSMGDAVFFPQDARHKIASLGANVNEVVVNTATAIELSQGLQADGTALICGNFSHNNPLFDRLLSQLPTAIILRHSNTQSSNAASQLHKSRHEDTKHIGVTECRGSTVVLMQLLLDEAWAVGEAQSALLNRLADCLLYLLLRDHLPTQTGAFAAMSHPKLSAAMSFMHSSYHQKLTVDTIAAQSFMSRSAFARQFKEVVGESPLEYLTQWRMSKAYTLLAEEGASTLAAAIEVGYASEAAFSKAFKRVTGFGPGQARTNLLEQQI